MRTKQSKFMMWKVNKRLWENVLDEMYHAALNLNLRLAFEQENDEEVEQEMDEEVEQEKDEEVRNMNLFVS